MISQAASPALQGLIWLARANGDTLFHLPVAALAKRAGLTSPYLAQVFQSLSRSDIVSARKGPGGGYRLERPATEISVLDVVQEVDGNSLADRCILRGDHCAGRTPCPLHDTRGDHRGPLLEAFRALTLSELGASAWGQPAP